jgi:hypothetical protein
MFRKEIRTLIFIRNRLLTDIRMKSSACQCSSRKNLRPSADVYNSSSSFYNNNFSLFSLSRESC